MIYRNLAYAVPNEINNDFELELTENYSNSNATIYEIPAR